MEINNIVTIVVAVVAALLGSGGLTWFMKRKERKDVLESGRVMGASEKKDEDRDDVIKEADDQIEKNEDVINRSREAIEKAREARGE